MRYRQDGWVVRIVKGVGTGSLAYDNVFLSPTAAADFIAEMEGDRYVQVRKQVSIQPATEDEMKAWAKVKPWTKGKGYGS